MSSGIGKRLQWIPVIREQTHRYWYSVHLPEIGVSHQCGWCFGADALNAALNAIEEIRSTLGEKADYVLANDVHVTHDTACSCLPSDQRYW